MLALHNQKPGNIPDKLEKFELVNLLKVSAYNSFPHGKYQRFFLPTVHTGISIFLSTSLEVTEEGVSTLKCKCCKEKVNNVFLPIIW